MHRTPALFLVGLALLAAAPAAAAQRESLTGLPLFSGSTPLTAKKVDMKMGLCNYRIETKNYYLPNGTVASVPGWLARTIPARIFRYSAGGQPGTALFAPDGSAMVHVEKSVSERFVRSTAIYYRFSPPVPADRVPFMAQGGC